MKTLTFLLAALLIASCGQTERPAPEARVTNVLDGCKIPEVSEFTGTEATVQAKILSASDCIGEKIDSAFEKIHGRSDGELTVDELQTLYQQHLVDLPLDEPVKWHLLRALLPLINPDGKPAIQKAWFHEALKWVKQNSAFLARLRVAERYRLERWEVSSEMWDLLDGLLHLISPKFRISLGETQNLVTEVCAWKRCRIRDKSLRDQIEAAWVMKSLFVQDIDGHGVRSDLSGTALLSLFRTGLFSLRHSPVTFDWVLASMVPSAVPPQLPDEWDELARIWADYFNSGRFAAISSGDLSQSLKLLAPRSGLSGLTADLVRITQRLSPRGLAQPGLHPVGLVPFLDKASTVAQDILESAKAFGACKKYYDCYISLRQAEQDPKLRRIALKGRLDQDWFIHTMVPVEAPTKRLDRIRLSWPTALSRFADRGLMTRVFDAFANGKDKIPLTGTYDEDLDEILDLSFTFLRFAALGQGTKKAPDGREEESVPSLIMVKPGALARVMGIVGDEWMPDGNQDGFLDSDEFYSIVKVYEDISQEANYLAWRSQAPRFYKMQDVVFDEGGNPYAEYDTMLFRRRDFVAGLGNTLEYDFSDLVPALKAMPESLTQSLFHALVPVPKNRPIEVYQLDGRAPRTLWIQDYVDSGATLGPAAVLNLLERLMILCDRNEDDKLDWTELDCAMPLILDGALQTVNSNLIDLDPGTYDGARLLLSFLKMKGLPLTVAKLIAVNGGILEFRSGAQVDALRRWVDDDMTVSWEQVARFIGAPDDHQLPIWEAEARRRFGECDFAPRDGKLRGKEELNCFATKVIQQSEAAISRLLMKGVSREGIEAFLRAEKSDVIRFGIKLATQDEATLQEALRSLPVDSDPEKILRLLEEIIRRSVPL